MDLSQSLKVGVKLIHKGKLVDRILLNKEHRQMKRNDIVSAKRHITDSPLNMSLEQPKKMESNTMRLEMLRKWQQERNKRKAEEKSKQKPLFKVCHVNESIYKEVSKLPPLSAKKEPTPSTFKFATSTHKFRVPENVKPLHFKYNGNSVKENVPLDGNVIMRVTRSQNQPSQAPAPAEKTRRKLNFKQENILPSKNLNLNTINNKTTQNIKDNKKTSSHSKPSVPEVTSSKSKSISKISSTRGSKENLNIVNSKPKLARENSDSENLRPRSTRANTKSNNIQSKVSQEIKTNSSKSKLSRESSDVAISKPKSTKSSLNMAAPKVGNNSSDNSKNKIASTGPNTLKSNVVKEKATVTVGKNKVQRENSDVNKGLHGNLRSNDLQRKSTTPNKYNTENNCTDKVMSSNDDKNVSKKNDDKIASNKISSSSEEETGGLNSTFNIDETDQILSKENKKSRYIEKSDGPQVRTRAMIRAEQVIKQKSPESITEVSNVDAIVDKFEKEVVPKTRSVSPRKKRQTKDPIVDEVTPKTFEFVMPELRKLGRNPNKIIATDGSANIDDMDTDEIIDTKNKKTEGKTPKKGRISLYNVEKSEVQPNMGMLTSKTPVKTPKARKSVSSYIRMFNESSGTMSTSKTPNSRKSLSSDIRILVESSELTPSSIMDVSLKSMSPNFPLESSFNDEPTTEPVLDVKSNHLTPDNKQAIVYVSPYVTMSRGKNSARKEYHKRHSKGGLCEASPEVTGPKAGAAYFYKVLDDEISRIQNMCQEWTLYKDESNLPEEPCNMINTAIGQSGLLISKRMKQFRGLIDSCESQNTDPLITCTDLHGYWDLLLIQVKNLDSRFDNLVKLRLNNWEEVLPEKKTIKARVPAKKPERKAPAKSSSSIRNAIKAARLKIQGNAEQQNVFDGGFFAVKSPRKSIGVEKTPSKGRKGLLQAVLTTDMKKRLASPGLAIYTATRKSRSIGGTITETVIQNTMSPVKSILKSRESKSAVKKAVIFEDHINEEEKATNKSFVITNENDANSPNLLPTFEDDPERRSSRLSRNRLF